MSEGLEDRTTLVESHLPLRGEMLSLDRLSEEARRIAGSQLWSSDDPPATTPLLAVTESASASLANDNRELALSARAGLAIPPAGEWLLDNYYLIEEQILLIHGDLPVHYGVELPRMASGVFAGFPRLYEAILALITHTDSRIEEDALIHFIDGYQEVSTLTIGEVWAVPIMLRIGVVDNLRRLSSAVLLSLRSERLADVWAERLILAAQDSPRQVEDLLHELDAVEIPSVAPFYLRLSQRLTDIDSGGEQIVRWLEQRLTAEKVVLHDAAVYQQHQQAANQISIANAITSVRFLDALEWREFFERVSLVEATLRLDPGKTYAHMDFASRDRYRHMVETLSRRCPYGEVELASEVVRLAQEALESDASDSVRGHVGWWLLSDGRYRLEQTVGYRVSLRERIYRGPLRLRGLFYYGLFALFMAVLLAVTAWYGRSAGAGWIAASLLALLAAIPLSEIALTLVNRASAFVFPPRILPKLDFLEPVADEHRTLVVVPALVSSVESVRSVIENLEVAYLGNRDINVGFCLLGDLRASDQPTQARDDKIVEAAVRGISELNQRYETEHGIRPFHLLIRSRRYNGSERAWMGWERKRGSLVELVREMRALGETSFSTKLGDRSFRESSTFVITIDADTILPRDGARKFISTIGHPLNRARFEPGDRVVRGGYGLVQPRVSMTLAGSRKSRHAQLFSGIAGVDPYASAVSDTYQDVFGEGSFTGKGIFEVDVFHALLSSRFPENSLLSHDLIEGSFLRTALASDVEVLDDYPTNYLAAVSRTHRWIRGDWQTLPYLRMLLTDADGHTSPNPLTLLHRWKIIDNLRRSLVPVATLWVLAAGWLLLPEAAIVWPLLITAAVFFPALFSLADSVVFRPHVVRFSTYVREALADFVQDSTRATLALATLPHQAWSMTDAIVRALWRQQVSRRRLLEWETAADAQSRAGTTPSSFWRAMGVPALLASGILGLLCTVNAGRALTAVPLIALWLSGPFFAWRVSRILPAASLPELDEHARLALRRIARKTWRFYDAFVVPDGHYLAPDNYQEDPGGVVAWRTSPTNIGLQLMAYVGAFDMGYLTVSGLTERVSSTLATMAGLERYKGHFYNWYDIRTLEPLRPTYVSTVDSGNLAGHLLVLRMGLLEASESPLVGPQLLAGARDTVRLVLEDLVAHQSSLGPDEAVRAFRGALDELERTLSFTDPPEELGSWHVLLHRLVRLARDSSDLLGRISEASVASDGTASEDSTTESDGPPIPRTPLECLRASLGDALHALEAPLELVDTLTGWAPLLADEPAGVNENPALAPIFRFTPSLVGLAEGLTDVLLELDDIASDPVNEAAAWAGVLASEIRESRERAVTLLARLRLDAEMVREMWEHADFRILYDSHRQLFSIGYNLAEGRLDSSYYDLFASECRLASFLAVAKGDVPQEHWFRLGRGLAGTPEGRALVSWSASMFEYLMPALVMRDWPGTMLEETYRTVVSRQVSYGRERGVPWGVSESAFNAKDAALTYQYQAFGIPGLGLKRGLSDDVVVAPYASILALPIDPLGVVTNLAAFSAEGAEGRYGYYESVDYTPGRVPPGKTRAVVKSFFAHHQGMSFVALSNALLGPKMQDRFHADPMVTSAELLLQERVPRNVQLSSPHTEEVQGVRSVREIPPSVARSYSTASTAAPATHFLSNGRYSVMVTSGGGGYSRWGDISVTRYREDVTRDVWGHFFYVRDIDTDDVFSIPHNPRPGSPKNYHVTFSPDKAEYRREDRGLNTVVEVAVSPEDDVEVRRISMTNRSAAIRRFELTSYFEIALAGQGADQAHKSFSNLFVETEALPDTNALMFSRRPRSSHEKRVWGLHVVACETLPCTWSYETDRARFVGRLRGATNPAAVLRGGPLSNCTGAVLDPCCAIRREIAIHPGETVRLVFSTGVAPERDEALRLTEKYHDIRSGQRAIDLAATASQLELRDLGISPHEAVTLERLASRLLLTDPSSPLKIKTPTENGLPYSGLWSLGVSGDHPILLVRVEELEHAPLVRQALLAHQYWSHKGLKSDLVIINTRPTGYSDALDERLRALVRTGHALQMLDKPGGVFLRRSDQMHPDVYNLLVSVARACLDGDGGTIELQLNRRGKADELPVSFVPTTPPITYPQTPFTRPTLSFDNELGGFDPKNGEYVIVLEGEQTTPAPWIDVLANQEFGCTVSEAGVGCTWSLNSHENRITTWNNDPVSDGSGEALYVRDEDTGEYWSPTPLPIRTVEPYVVRHGRGSVRFEHTTHGIGHVLDWFVPVADPVRVCRLSLSNHGEQMRRLSVTQFVEWVLGDSRSRAQQLVVTWFDAENEILTAHNHHNPDFPGRCAFLACDTALHSWTASRKEFVGRNGSPSAPAAMGRSRLGGASGRFYDNCGALMTSVEIAPGATVEISFLLGQTATLEESRALVARYRDGSAVQSAFETTREFWNDLLGVVKVKTPDERLDLMLNGQLLYQATACRLWGRTATYQSSGAYGFRDQLQDVMALLIARPDLVRAQILEACRHQFPEGDVLHWWQPYSGRGVRTHITDDRHWLPLVVAEYLSATGDFSLLDEETTFVDGPLLPADQEDAYLQPTVSETTETVYDHCLRALETGRPTGAHGLPLMGGGDWNDGMNRVGHAGRGESVWLAWFLGYTLTRFAAVCESRGDSELGNEYRAWAVQLAASVEMTSWDGSWYRRAYFDDGTPLGSHESEECRIDAIAQAWATISGLGNQERRRKALDSVEEKLIRRESGLIALLSPPFNHMAHDPGYIKGYVPGVRENGGQYTHAALWVILAYLLQGDGDEAASLLEMINPISHALDPEAVSRYKVEPYVVAADVYAVEPHTGRGGWTWYTGSASWFYRVALNNLLGFTVSSIDGHPHIVIDPCIPKHWSTFSIEYRHGTSTYRITVENPRGVNRGVAYAEIDGVRAESATIRAIDDGTTHEVRVVMLGG